MLWSKPRFVSHWAGLALVIAAPCGACGVGGEQQVTPSHIVGGDASPASPDSATAAEPQGTAGAETPAAPGSNAGLLVLGAAVLGPGANAELLVLKKPIEAAAAATGVNANVIAATLWAEARGIIAQPGANLMQIGQTEFDGEKTAHPEIVGDITDSASNIMSGAFYLRLMQLHMQQRYGRDDLGITMRAYNSGENSTDPADLSATPDGTGVSDYVTNVTSFVTIIASGVGELPP